MLAEAAAEEGDFDTACSLAEESASTVRGTGDDDRFRVAMHELGWMSFSAGESERARALHEENLERARSAGDDRMEGGIAGATCADRDQRWTCIGCSRDAPAELRHQPTRRPPFGITFDLDYLAAAAAANDQPRVAARLLARADTLRSEIGIRIRNVDAAANAETLRSIQGQLDDDEVAAARAEGSTMSLDAAVEHALAAID